MQRTAILIVLASAMAGIVVSGCHSSGETPQGASDNPIKRMMATPETKGGAELWAENCNRCHNARPPEYYSDAQWDTIVHHMRLRANLTGEEARTIATFLKASN
jgi:hypothetical protein